MKQSTMHFKMTNGEEVICHVVDWAEDTEDDYIVKNALCVVQKSISDNQTRYMFKPWFTMVERTDQYICIAKEHIIACTVPNTILYTEYRRAVNEMISSSRRKPSPLDSVQDLSPSSFTERQKAEYDKVQKDILDLIEEMERRSKDDINFDSLDDSDEPSNVIKFPGPDSIH